MCFCGEKDPEVVKSNNQYATIENLHKYTNYTVWVVAYTKVGDGVKTKPFYCRTNEDVPSAPQAIKAIPASSTKIIISWLPPEFPNGDITGYTFYMSMLEGGREEGTHKRILGPYVEMHETQRTQESATYQFWLTASTKVGEGEKTDVVTVPPNNKVPARIVSFSQRVITPWKENLELTCRKVGSPAPVTIWRLDGHNLETNARKTIAKNGTLYIRETQATDAGNYTCSVENTWGKDEIIYSVVVKVPPEAPNLTVVTAYSDSLLLEWSDNNNGGSPILGYVINYKRDNGDWEELQVDAKSYSHLLSNLWCGTRYQLYITAYNKIGTGLPCDIVNTHTKGNPPVQPKHSQMITNNSTSVTCWLDSWGDGGCGILYFMIESRIYGRSTWTVVSSHIPPTERIYTVSDLVPGTKYQLRVTAHNNAGSTTAVYNFTTLSPQGVIYNTDSNAMSPMTDSPFYANIKVLLPVCLSLIMLLGLLGAVFVIRRKKMSNNQSRLASSSMSETPSLTQLQNKQNRDQQYLAVRCNPNVGPPRGSNSNDSGSFGKAESNEYIEDICPYATFQLNKQPYSESSYSGNVYSGPYHSVRGSFVYHDVKPESYHSKEPEYTKVRRKVGRLRDPHSESQESDNPGSTDSEVRKILTLHIPITEYDTLGSESDNDVSARAMNSAKYRPQRETQDESSSSSDATPTSMSRKSKPPYSTRKAAKTGTTSKRHIRSSSGYSSNHDETTFSIANFPPNYQDHINPPARFSDEKSKAQTSPRIRANSKLQRETFQINV